jgi:hypothetical protein
MIPRGTVIAALCVVQLAIIFAAVDAVEGGRLLPSFGHTLDAPGAPALQLAEGGQHQTFSPDARSLTVDIGYADLTIHAGSSSRIDVSLEPDSSLGIFRASEPITARQDGDTVRIEAGSGRGWSTGDDRMVNVEVPADTRVTVIRAGDIKVDGLRAEATIKSVGEGSISIADYDAPALRLASRGSISLQGIVTDWLGVASSDGHVEGSALRVRSGAIDSDGHVTLGLSSGSDTLVTAETGDGKILTTGFAPAPATEVKGGGDDDSASQAVRVGDGNGHLNVHSSDGNITLAQEN